ncbi:MAG: hypothetical protein ACE5KA_07845 [Nitrososphaerales archaeon]
MLPNSIEFRVSSINLEHDVEVILGVLGDLESVVHKSNNFRLNNNAVYGMGWYFYELSMNTELVKKLLDVYGNEIRKMNGRKVEHKFTNWLMRKLRERNCNAQIKLKSEKEFRGFWPWLLK